MTNLPRRQILCRPSGLLKKGKAKTFFQKFYQLNSFLLFDHKLFDDNEVFEKRGANGEGKAGRGEEASGLLVRRHLPQHEPARAPDQHAEAGLPGDLKIFPPHLFDPLCYSTSQTRAAKRMRSFFLTTTTCFSFPQRKSFTTSQVTIKKYQIALCFGVNDLHGLAI